MVTFSLKEREKKMNKKSSGQKLSTQASKIMRSNNSSQIQCVITKKHRKDYR